MDDIRSKVVGGITTGLILWESCCIYYLLNNCSSWLEMRKEDMDTLVKLQNLFYNTLLGVKNCPALSMLWDLGALTIQMRILKEKLMLYHHISNLSEESLAYKILNIQEQMNLPSLRNEVKMFLSKYNVIDVKSFNKLKWKTFVLEKIKELNREFLLEEMKKYKKLDIVDLSLEDLDSKSISRTSLTKVNGPCL